MPLQKVEIEGHVYRTIVVEGDIRGGIIWGRRSRL